MRNCMDKWGEGKQGETGNDYSQSAENNKIGMCTIQKAFRFLHISILCEWIVLFNLITNCPFKHILSLFFFYW